MTRLSALLCLALLLTANHQAFGDPPPAGKVRIVDREGDDFDSIQAAIDVAAGGAVVAIGAGRYDERLKIGKSIQLVGAGPDKTIIGPTVEARDAHDEIFHARMKAIRQEAESRREPADARELVALRRARSVSVVKIENAQGVELRSLRVTSPGTPRAGAGLENGFHAIELKNAGVEMTDCAVVGCLGHGVYAEGESNLKIDDCLIAGCWNTGVKADTITGRLMIRDSDIRNCLNHNLWLSTVSDAFSIEGCRISGAGGDALIFGGQPTIVRNAIFENTFTGIEAIGSATIKQNLLYKNRLGVWLRSSENQSWVSGNLFMENEFCGISTSGMSEPMIRDNVFMGGKSAIDFSPLKSGSEVLEPTGKFYIRENLFWNIVRPVLRNHFEKNNQTRAEVIEMPASARNWVEDPQITIDSDGRVVLAETSPAHQVDFAGIAAITMKSRWPLSDEERAMIPDGGARSGAKWKLKPAAANR
jgi:parallel beta-helix repeat protein